MKISFMCTFNLSIYMIWKVNTCPITQSSLGLSPTEHDMDFGIGSVGRAVDLALALWSFRIRIYCIVGRWRDCLREKADIIF